MSKFRIPRKKKKKITGIFLYPKNSIGGYLVGFPRDNQKDYTAYNQGILKDIFKKTKAQIKQYSIDWEKKYNAPIEISDQELLIAIEDVFAAEFRESAYNILKRAKNHSTAVIDYYNFINLYNDDKDNLCCLTIDSAENNLKK